MEESLDILIAIIAIVSGLIGVASKSRKNGKKKTESKPKMFNWDEVSEELEKRFNEFVHSDEQDDELPEHEEAETGMPIIPYAPVGDHSIDTAIPVPPVAPAIMPVQVMPSTEGKASEGIACALHADMKPVVRKANEPILVERESRKSSLNPGRMTASQLRSAFIMSEVIGKPVALRSRGTTR